jgi:hypothetical protein
MRRFFQVQWFDTCVLQPHGLRAVINDAKTSVRTLAISCGPCAIHFGHDANTINVTGKVV